MPSDSKPPQLQNLLNSKNFMKSLHLLRKPFVTLVLLVAFGGLSSSSLAKTFVLPHVLEKSGSISSVNYTFDTSLFMTYNKSLNGSDKGSAVVELYLYDEQTGQLMQGASKTICGPCTFQLSGQNRKIAVNLEDLIINNGGGFDVPLKLGFGVIVVGGNDPDAVNIQGFVVNSHTGPFDVSLSGFDPQGPLSTNAPPAPQLRRTFSFPHVLETSGRIASDPYSFDTTIFATYTGGLPGAAPGSGASIDLYLYDQATGQPMIGGGGSEVCNPCTFGLGTGPAGTATPRKRSIVIDDLILAAGGFGGASGKPGMAVVSVGGTDPAGVSLQEFVVNAHTSAFDLSILSCDAQEVNTNPPPTKRAFVIPHILEKSGLATAQTFTFDTTIFATYAGGIADIPEGKGATLELYLYDDTGALMQGLSGIPVCDPCTFGLGIGAAGTPNPRKQSIRIDDLITTQGGGFDSSVKLGFGILVVGGSDPDGVNLQGFVVNSHSGPFDLSVFGFEPQPLGAAARVAGTGSPGLPRRAFVLPHVLEKSGTINSTQFTFDTTLFATYVGGLPGSVSSNGATVKLFLYDPAGLPLTGSTGEVCNPCSFDLSTSARKTTINVDDLILTRGGGFGGASVKTGFGVVVLDGDAPNVNLESFIVNSHSSAFDLSVFGFEPQPLEAAGMAAMPIGISADAGHVFISVPTVIGGHYTIESKDKIDQANSKLEDKFDGDGTVQIRSIRPSFSQQYFRVNGF
jgi:hypothetical protein